jgi:beta-glucosidase/6-phospho-beta-glucosidase/beta-galactosidase
MPSKAKGEDYMTSISVRSPFASFFLAGFECSSHRRYDGRRLDMLAATHHDRFASEDYRELANHGISAARDGLRWHLIETSAGRYDWSSFLPMLRAARDQNAQVIWDLCHYGWPDGIDIWSSEFVDRFARFAAAAAQVVRDEGGAPLYCPINEMSFWAWGGGDVAHFNPGCVGRGGELKRQLVRATIAAIDAIRQVDSRARFITAEPLIQVACISDDPEQIKAAETYHWYQYEALDMLGGALEPELGGSPEFIDIVGINYYPDNQWFHGGGTIPLGHNAYRPFRDMLAEAHRRYQRPILISETGAEGSGRSAWLHYVCSEVHEAIEEGVPVQGVCLYPILDYPGWANDRTCFVGLLSDADEHGRRQVCTRLAKELYRQQMIFEHAPAEQELRPLMRAVG